MIQGRKPPRKIQSIVPATNSENPSNLHINGGRLTKPPSPYSLRNPRPLQKNRLHELPNKRPFTAQPKSNLLETSQNNGSSFQPFRSAGQLRNGEKKYLRPQPLPDLQMAPLTVPLLPQVGLRSPSFYNKRSPSPLRSQGPSPRLSSSPYSHRKNFCGPESIQLLRPNNTLVELHKVDLDRRGLTSWPSYTGTEPPRLLSLQHNMLTKLDLQNSLPSLVLLDLYHNHLKSLVGLHTMPNLRILLLAKNRISRLDGLEVLTKLEVLDLHGNQLHHLSNLAHLKELRLLNLAGNLIRHVNGLRGLDALAELNFKRNQIRTVAELNLLPKLEKVFLSHNEIYRYEDIAILQKCAKLRELSLDDNPISKHPSYFHTTVVKFYRLKRLDDQDLTIETRRVSERLLQKAKEKERAKAAQITDEERRKSAINSAMKHWSTLKNAQHMIRSKLKKPAPVEEKENEIEETGEEERVPNVTEKTDSSHEVKVVNSDSEDQDEIIQECIDESIQRLEIKNVPIINEIIEDNCEPVSTTSETDEVENSTTKEVPKFSLQVPTEVFTLKPKAGFSRSKSSLDMNTSNKISMGKTVRPNSGVDFRNRPMNTVKPSLLNPGSKEGKFRSTVKAVIRSHSESKLLVNIQSNQPRDNLLDNKNSLTNSCKRVLQKSESSLSLKSLPDRVLTAAVTKIQSNLQRLHNNSDTNKHSLDRMMNSKSVNAKQQYKNDNKDLESSISSLESDSDSDSLSTISTANTENKKKKNLSNVLDLKVPFRRSRHPSKEKIQSPAVERSPMGVLREQGPNFLAELDGRVLRLYGSGALKCTELAWEKGATTTATTIHFQYINYEEIVDIFPRLRLRFPHLENFVFIETNIVKCSQLNALAELHQVNSIDVKREGNLLIQDKNWRLYAIFRLSHWGLSIVNGVEITDNERQEASYLYSPLSQLAFTCLPRHQLNALISSKPQSNSSQLVANAHEVEGGGKENQEEEELNDWEGPKLNAPHLQELIGKEALQFRPPSKLTKEEQSTLSEASASTQNLMIWALDSVLRLKRLEESWPSVLHDLTRDSVSDIVKPNYGKICLDALKKDMGWKK